MRLTTTLSFSAATLVLAGLCATAQPLRTAATEAAVPAVAAAKPAGTAAAFSPAPAAATQAPAATPAPAAPSPDAVASAAPAAAILPESTSDGIAATVGDNSVSDYELEQRLKLFFATSGFKPTAEDVKRARKFQLENLIDEHIQMAEARRRKVNVSRLRVDKELETIAKRQGVTVKQMTDELAKAGSDIEVLRTQTIASLAWRDVLYSEFSDQVVSTPAMIDDALRRAAEGANKTHYHVMEIFLPGGDTPEKDAEVKKQIEEIEAKIRSQQAPFRNLAQQYSRNPSAAAGGDMGWVYDGQLDPVLNAALATMNTNEISKPIRAKGGWYLLGVPERQEALGTNVAAAQPEIVVGPQTVLPLARMLLPLAANTPADVVQNLLRNAEQIRTAAVSCDALEKLSQDPQLKGSIFAKLGDMKIGDLSEQMQKALMATKGGEASAPFQDDAGIEIIVRCDKRAPPPRTAFAMPTREEIEGQLFSEQISAMARRYMRDLRRQANVQERNDNAVLDAALIQ